MTTQAKRKYYTKVETYKWFTKVGAVEPLEADNPDLDDHGLVETLEDHHDDPMGAIDFISLLTAELDNQVVEHMDFTVSQEDIRALGDNTYQVDYVTPEGDWVLHVKCYVTTLKVEEHVSYEDIEAQLFS